MTEHSTRRPAASRARPSGAARSSAAGGTDAGAERPSGRRRPSEDPEGLSVAIGARQQELAAMAARRQDVDAPPSRAKIRMRGWDRARTPASRAAVLALAILGAAAAVAGLYRGLPALMLDSPSSRAFDRRADAALSRAERERVERLLARLDFRVGAVDGRIDATTRAAIERYRRYQGVPPRNGRPTRRLLEDLREVAALTPAGEVDQ